MVFFFRDFFALFRSETVPWDNSHPEIINVFFSFRFRFFRVFFVHCAEPPRASHLPALQNSPFADLLACVDLSKVEMESVAFLWDALKQGFGLRTSPEVRKSEVRKSEVRKSEVRKWSMLSKVLNRDRRSFFLSFFLSFFVSLCLSVSCLSDSERSQPVSLQR